MANLHQLKLTEMPQFFWIGWIPDGCLAFRVANGENNFSVIVPYIEYEITYYVYVAGEYGYHGSRHYATATITTPSEPKP